MNLLNLILIVLIITIEPFISLEFNNGLVFIKPENLTKTELVEKFKELSSSKLLKNLKDIKTEDKKNENEVKKTLWEYLKSYYLRLSAFIFKYKNLITFMNKIALFAILIKYFRKIKLMRFTFRIIKYIFFSIFGIFISDIYGLNEIILQIEYYWINYIKFIHESRIYKTLIKLFHVVTDENKSEVIEDKFTEIENKFESKIINSEIPSSETELKNEKIVHDKTSGGNKKENWFEIDKIFWIGLSLISLTLIYAYWDSIIELFKNVKPSDGSSEGSNTPIFLDPKEEYEKYFKEIDQNQELYDLDVIKDQNKGKVIDYSEVENIKWEDSPTTPKPSTSNLPERNVVIIPISKK